MEKTIDFFVASIVLVAMLALGYLILMSAKVFVKHLWRGILRGLENG